MLLLVVEPDSFLLVLFFVLDGFLFGSLVLVSSAHVRQLVMILANDLDGLGGRLISPLGSAGSRVLLTPGFFQDVVEVVLDARQTSLLLSELWRLYRLQQGIVQLVHFRAWLLFVLSASEGLLRLLVLVGHVEGLHLCVYAVGLLQISSVDEPSRDSSLTETARSLMVHGSAFRMLQEGLERCALDGFKVQVLVSS